MSAGDVTAVTSSADTDARAAPWSVEVPVQVGRVLDVDSGDSGLVLATVSAAGGLQAIVVTLHLRGVEADGTVLWAEDRTGAVGAAGAVRGSCR